MLFPGLPVIPGSAYCHSEEQSDEESQTTVILRSETTKNLRVKRIPDEILRWAQDDKRFRMTAE